MARLRTRPQLFRAKKQQSTTNAVRKNISNSSLSGHNTGDENFLFDSYLAGFKSTQQLELDFSDFTRHTFFAPARAKVDVALFKAINQYPYTGSRADIDNFLVTLTGFERYVFDQIPKNMGFLFFSGTQPSETLGGTHISVSPIAGKNFDGAPGATGEARLIVNQSPFELESHLFVPAQANDNQVVFQRLATTAGYTLALSQSASTADCQILFLVSSASDSYVVASGSILKGQFSHVRACLFNNDDGKQALIYVNDDLIGSSSDTQDFGSLDFLTSSFIIGSGSRHTILDYDFLPIQTLSGALDEVRFFVGQRSDAEVEKYKDTQMYASGGLELYFRFDEPSGSYDMNHVVLDYSGKCLHSTIVNYNSSLRQTSSLDVPLAFQNPYYSPILYPDQTRFSNLITDLYVRASSYDEENPNVVTNLVPRHYLLESARAVGLPNFDSGVGEVPTLESVPGTGELPLTSALIRLLILMSISLDEIKQFVDSLSSLMAIELGDEEQVSSQMIRYAADYFGIDLPNFFTKSTSEQMSFGEDISDSGITDYTLKGLRNDLWRRILANMTYINAAKGTKNAVRAAMLSSGIIPDNFFIIREYGMAGESRISDMRDLTYEVTSMLDFSGSFTSPVGPLNSLGIRSDSPNVVSSYLSGSRTEIGYPFIKGTFVDVTSYPPHGISDNASDGLFTSGSFSIEASYVFDKKYSHPPNQSLFRLLTTGSTAPYYHLIGNMMYDQQDDVSGSLTFVLGASSEIPTNAPDPLRLVLSGVNLFDGERWTVGIERDRDDRIGNLTSSYTLRCSRQVGDQVSFFKTSSFYSVIASSESDNVLANVSPTYSALGSFVVIGSQSLGTSTQFLNSETGCTSSNFTGKVSHIRFFSARSGDTPFIEHSKNFANMGTNNPELGLGFDLVQTGAFNRLRIDASCDQATTSSDGSGNIRIFDFSQNDLHFSGSGFETNKEVIKPYLTSINRVSPRFDLLQVNNKVRVRGLDNPSETDPDYVISGPVYEIYDTDEIIDDVRFGIEHSIVKALNEDIMTTVGDSQYIDNSLGQPVDLFNDSYSNFDHLNQVYFNRLTGKMDFMRTYDVFRWVDIALTNLVESILPKRTKFMGINYVIESHILERGKMRYRGSESFMLTTPGSFEAAGETPSAVARASSTVTSFLISVKS